MEKNLLFLIMLVFCSFINAQTTFWTENFGTGCNQLQLANGLNPGGNGAWSVTIQGAEDPQANSWYVSATENGNPVGSCGTGCGSNQTLHVGSIPNSTGFSPCTTGDCGASYDAGGTSGFGGTSTGTNKRAESPVINCSGHTNITVAFRYMENGDGTNDDATLWYFDGSTWTQIDPLAKTATTCGGGQGLWTAFSLALPASANNNPNVKIGFLWVNNDDGIGSDPSFAVDSVTLTDAVAAIPVVSISPVPSATVCQTSTLTLNGSATNSPTNYSWTVSPSGGVTFTPDAITPTVSVTFTTAGSYTFTLSATNASGTGTSTQTITVLPMVIPSVTITSSPTGTVCPGTVVSFTATPTNGGTTPAFQWDLNNVSTGTNSNTYTVIPNNGDQVYVTLTSNAACASPSTAASNTITMNVGSVVPSVSITASPTGTVCPGTVVSFTATPTNGGTTPIFQWDLNNVSTGTNSTTYTVIPNNGDQVFVTLTSNATCTSPTTAVSNTITLNVASVTPSVTITSSPTGTVCPGAVVSFSATPTNGGTTPAFQWNLNGASAGTNSNTYTVIPNNGDQVFVTLTSNAACASPSTANSNTITESVSSGSLTVGGTKTICEGDSVQLSSNGTNWNWSPSSGLGCAVCAMPNASPSVTTIYTVSATIGSCTVTNTEMVVVNLSAGAEFIYTSLFQGVPQTISFSNISLNSNGYIWNFGDASGEVVQTNPQHTYNTAGNYTVTLIAFSANGCNDTINEVITVSDTTGLTMPNVFTPNGDGINDYFAPNAHNMTSLTCLIYDRWGSKMATLDNTNQQYWDGHTTSGLACSAGTYFYIVTGTDANGKSYNLKGFFELIR